MSLEYVEFRKVKTRKPNITPTSSSSSIRPAYSNDPKISNNKKIINTIISYVKYPFSYLWLHVKKRSNFILISIGIIIVILCMGFVVDFAKGDLQNGATTSYKSSLFNISFTNFMNFFNQSSY